VEGDKTCVPYSDILRDITHIYTSSEPSVSQCLLLIAFQLTGYSYAKNTVRVSDEFKQQILRNNLHENYKTFTTGSVLQNCKSPKETTKFLK